MNAAEQALAEIAEKEREGYVTAIATRWKYQIVQPGELTASSDGKGLRYRKLYIFPYQIRFGRKTKVI